MGRMRLVVFFALTTALLAANFKLYLKDGSHHTVTEYKIEGDRVRYYSAERSDWEEIPLDLIDLKRTEAERKTGDDKRRADAQAQDEEDKAEREIAREIASIPADPGTYLIEREKPRAIPQGEVKLVTDKKRSVLKAVTPIPILSGKATVEMDGERSPNLVTDRRPEFYLRQSDLEGFAIVRMGAKKGVRVVEKVSILPVVKEMLEERDEVEIFRRQFAEGLFKIWPTKDLTPGEYAVIQFTDGKVNLQVWDFRVE